MREFYLSTGQQNFDMIFDNKGILCSEEDGTSILIQGSAGLGKTLLALQLVTKAINKMEQCKCLYYTFDQTGSEILKAIKYFKLDNDLKQKPIIVRNLEINPTHPEDLIIIDCHEHIPNINELGDRIADDVKHIEFYQNSLNTKIRSENPSIDDSSADHITFIPSENKISIIVVVDSIGAIRNLEEIKRVDISRMVHRINMTGAISILVREYSEESKSWAPSEYVNNVVIDLKKQVKNYCPYDHLGIKPHTIIEVLKTRNQLSYRGPHEYEIIPPIGDNPGEIVVYPSLDTISKHVEYSKKEKEVKERKEYEEKRKLLSETTGKLLPKEEKKIKPVKFGEELKALDEALSRDNGHGMLYGHSLLMKGEPGCFKTEVGIRFLIEGFKKKKNKEENFLFVSCRLDNVALKGLRIFDFCNIKGESRDKFIEKNIKYIDARHPFKTPAQIMTEIRFAVNENEKDQVRRAVVFGFGMLDSLTLFKGQSLPFMQVLIKYFKDMGISAIFIDWPKEKNTPLRPTDEVIDFVDHAITIETLEEKKITLVRRNHRFINLDIGKLQMDPNTGELSIIT
jgi:KaiC/GvpD/RAD55 family RecA-like ATPase